MTAMCCLSLLRFHPTAKVQSCTRHQPELLRPEAELGGQKSPTMSATEPSASVVSSICSVAFLKPCSFSQTLGVCGVSRGRRRYGVIRSLGHHGIARGFPYSLFLVVPWRCGGSRNLWFCFDPRERSPQHLASSLSVLFARLFLLPAHEG